MSERHHHHDHRHRDDASLFKERSLNSIEFRRKFEKWLKFIVVVIAILMVMAVIYVYTFG